jgi:hemoglobin/transferrin/lactoferrin receptor protein
VHGVELVGSWRFHPQFSVFGGFSWVYGEVDTYPTSLDEEERETLDKLMPAAGHFGLRWEATGGRSWAECVLVAAGKADELSTADERDTQRIPPGGTPGYAVLNLRAGWEVLEGLRASAGVENLTDEDYRIHGSGQNEPGTNVVLAVDWRF